MEQEAALRILRAWVGQWRDGPGEMRANAAVRALALGVNVDAEFEAAVGYALNQGWLEIARPGWLWLTEAGEVVAHQ